MQTFSLKFFSLVFLSGLFSFHLLQAEEMVKYKIQADSHWIPAQFTRQTVPESALDFRFLQDAPAGKFGFAVATPEGQLVFEKRPDRAERFYGVNLCFTANFLNRDGVELLVEDLIRGGYNIVRLHHFENQLLKKDAADSATLDPIELDKLDYLIFRLKESGIYITTDLYSMRTFRPGDGVNQTAPGATMKTLVAIDPAAMDNWKKFARNWLTHRNPYTKLSLAEEPALIFLNLVNEDPLMDHWMKSGAADLYRKNFEEWKKQHNHPQATAQKSDRRFRQFIQETQENAFKEMRTFLKEQLKVRALLTSLNFSADIPLALTRSRVFDLNDIHGYFDHPSFVNKKWHVPYRLNQKCAIAEKAGMPRWMMGARVFGMPQFVTEFNYCNPNRYRAEGGPLIGAYAALQNWSGLVRFAWSHGEQSIYTVRGGVYGFDGVNDPLARLSDKIAILLFRRGDVQPGKQKIAWSVNSDFFDGSGRIFFPHQTFNLLGLMSQIGSVVNGRIPQETEIITAASSNDLSKLQNPLSRKLYHQYLKQGTLQSDTGEIRLHPGQKILTIVTPRAESVTLNSGNAGPGILNISNADGFQTAALFSLENQPIAQSKRLLLIHLTDMVSEGAVFDGPEKKILYFGGGQRPLLLRSQSDARLTLPGHYQINALNADGKTIGSVTPKRVAGHLYFRLDPGAFPGGVMAYELTRQ